MRIFFRVVFERQSKTENSTNQHQSPNPPLTKHLSGAPRPCIPWLARSASCFGSRLNHGYKRRARTCGANDRKSDANAALGGAASAAATDGST